MKHHTLSLEEAHEALNEAADTFPPEFFGQLNGGIVLQPQLVHSPEGANLYILGCYHNEPYGLGRYIEINYGSFVRVHGHQTVQLQKQALARVLRHELTHHIESLAGVRDLEEKDALFIEQYRQG